MSDVAEGGDAARLPAGQFLTKRFPVLTYGATPDISTDDWGLRVWGVGLAEPVEFDWGSFNSLGAHETTRDFHCVTTWSRFDNRWNGIPVSAFWDALSPHLDSTPAAVMLHCYGDYTTNLLIDDFLEPDNLFATQHDGRPLSAGHGGPMRFVCHHLYGWKSAKWINGVELLDADARGFWEVHGYHIRGDPWGEERFSYQE
ncbi:MAG: molybdopterin-dependent oxidoreductase [Candidatus Poseidoniales archaeon]|nr:molybdopterin-dependent oxidoreductase [Candidatus Poseidoniales archaeon]